ncbi:hypothetical protein NADFUDRAFT_48675 [Nadsonia fulvescens var. elongata DSM 6958]|uniref:Sorting nexin MVP1 n=1 Tax=Nadsonia fulvescens var. elongata DSM 6958 TaxID=857566 RepID=A0A1E3PRZ8_9ASCO|nr:hypothetical protein NADFUDRAFT_48675 [Nadsonia fulvescens var. elongata DSM 6958]
MSSSVPYNPPDPWANEFANQPNSLHSQQNLGYESAAPDHTLINVETSIDNSLTANSLIPESLQTSGLTPSLSNTWTDARGTLSDSFDPHRKDSITVNVKPEKDGVFLFRHVSYIIETLTNPSQQGSSLSSIHSGTSMQDDSTKSFTSSENIIRRYSDFAWLQNHLHIKYPCRLVPILPPKSLTVDGKYLSADSSFLDRRRKGLTRFLNNLLAHPLLTEDDLVKKFITLDGDQFLNWKKNTPVNNTKDEFRNRVVHQGFIDDWVTCQKTEPWPVLRQEIINACEIFTHLTLLVDKIVKRIEENSNDYSKLSYWIQSSIGPLSKLYSFEAELAPLVMYGLREAKTSLDDQAHILKDQSRGYAIGVLEDAKRMLASLTSVKKMFERVEREMLNMKERTTLLKDRISTDETKLSTLKSYATHTLTDDNQPRNERQNRKTKDYSNDITKIVENIAQDKAEIDRIINREWLIRECVEEEICIFQKTQFAISRIVKEIISEQVKYSEILSNDWSNLDHKVSEMLLE